MTLSSSCFHLFKTTHLFQTAGFLSRSCVYRVTHRISFINIPISVLVFYSNGPVMKISPILEILISCISVPGYLVISVHGYLVCNLLFISCSFKGFKLVLSDVYSMLNRFLTINIRKAIPVMGSGILSLSWALRSCSY